MSCMHKMHMTHPRPTWLVPFELKKGQRLNPETEFKPTAKYVKIPCRKCGSIVTLTETKAQKYWAGFCSKKCAYDTMRTGPTKEMVCQKCGKTYHVRPGSSAKYCSYECHGMAKRKVWTDFDRRLRNSWQYHEWRSKVLVRDNFVCQDCFEKGNIAHHLELFALVPEKRFIMENGITLCNKCHTKRHTKETH